MQEGLPRYAKEKYISGGRIHQAFCRTLFNDEKPLDWQYSPDRLCRVIVREWRTQIKQEMFVQLSLMVAALTRCIAKRRLIITRKGYIGLRTVDTQPGDDVFVLAGGSVPFVLRKAFSKHGKPGAHEHLEEQG